MHNRDHREIEKKIFFYRAYVDSRLVARQADFNFETLLAPIAQMPHTEQGRYLDAGELEDSVFSVNVDGARTIQFGKIRRSNLPLIVDGDRFSEISVSRRGGIFECSHVVYFPPATIGIEFNFYAPRMSRLAEYIERKCGFGRRLEFRPMISADALAALNKFDRLKVATLKVSSDVLPQVKQRARGPVANVIAAGVDAGAEAVEVTLSAPTGHDKASLPNAIVNGLRGLLGIPNYREVIDKLGVRGYFTGKRKLEAVDLLEDELVAKRKFLRESLRGKTLDHDHAYRQIREAYTELGIRDRR